MINLYKTKQNKTKMQQLRTAIELKEAIERVPIIFDSIGTLPIEIWEEEEKAYEDEFEQPPEEKKKYQLSSMIQLANKAIKTSKQSTFDGVLFEKNVILEIHLNDLHFSGPIQSFDLKTLKSFYDKAPQAGYGDQKNLKTMYDSLVRVSREISADHFKVSSYLIKKIESLWQKHFLMNVTAIPYKINLYGPNGFFNRHKDTPAKGMIGTFLVGLGEYGTNFFYPGLKVGENMTWKSNSLSWCAFFSDIPHEVQKLPDNAYRANIAFKIYINQEAINVASNKRIMDATTELVGCLSKCMEKEEQFGIVLSHDYSINEEALKGIDLVFVNAIKQLPNVEFTIIPILNNVMGYYPCEGSEENREYDSQIYALTSDVINYSLKKSSKKPVDIVSEPINFYSLDLTAFCWKNNYNEPAQYTGNESRPGEEDSLYISRAIIVTKWNGHNNSKEPEKKKIKLI